MALRSHLEQDIDHGLQQERFKAQRERLMRQDAFVPCEIRIGNPNGDDGTRADFSELSHRHPNILSWHVLVFV